MLLVSVNSMAVAASAVGPVASVRSLELPMLPALANWSWLLNAVVAVNVQVPKVWLLPAVAPRRPRQ